MSALKITAGVLGFAAEFASTEETRYYLGGVYVEPSENGVIAVATDGHRLVAIYDADGSIERPAIIYVPRAAAARFRTKFDATVTAVALGEKSKDRPIAARMAPKKGPAESFALDEIDGKFPDWRAVFPVGIPTDGVLPAFQGRYVGAYDGLARVGGNSGGVHVVARGPDAPAIVRPSSTSLWPWLGVLMPIRMGHAVPQHYPTWLNLKQKKVRRKAQAVAA